MIPNPTKQAGVEGLGGETEKRVCKAHLEDIFAAQKCCTMKVVVVGLSWLLGASTVAGFVSRVTPTLVHRSLRPPRTSESRRSSRPHRPVSQCSSLLMGQRERLGHYGGEKEGLARKGQGLPRLPKLAGGQKVALLVGAAAATSQILPHAAVAAEATLPLVSAAMGGSFVDKLTSSGFFQAFSLVFVSEIGDKTFFIAALLAAKTSRLISFAGSVGALAVMTVLAVLLGLAFHSVPAVFTSGLPIDDIVAAVAFLYFGIITLKDAYQLPEDSNEGIDEERAEAEESVKELQDEKTPW